MMIPEIDTPTFPLRAFIIRERVKKKIKVSRPDPVGRIAKTSWRTSVPSLSLPLSPPPPGFPVYSLIRSPLTAALYYMNAWNGLLVDRTTALVLVGLSAR